VQLGIRQARYVGRTKTLFQVCLAAAVANLTLLAATTGTLSAIDSAPTSPSLTLQVILLSISSLLSAAGLSILVVRRSIDLTEPIDPNLTIARPSTPAYRPGF
jgi:hypothetical protein